MLSGEGGITDVLSTRMTSSLVFRVSAILGFFAVALGAFGAHGLKSLLARNSTTAIWETAALYHLVHAGVLLFVADRKPFCPGAWRSFAAGILIFSGSLYLLAVTNVGWLGAVTPIGGVCLLAGWLTLAIRR